MGNGKWDASSLLIGQKTFQMKFATHWNGNLLCSIDTETTGLNCRENEMIQVAVIPLTFNYEINKEVDWFNVLIRPELLSKIDPIAEEKVTKVKMINAINNGMERWTSVERFEEWFAKLKLGKDKKIIPLGCNYDFDKGFITEWLGGKCNYDHYIRSDCRDVQRVASYLNDVAYHRQEPIPFPKFNLSYLCSCLHVEQINAHDALSDAIATMEVYRRLLGRA